MNLTLALFVYLVYVASVCTAKDCVKQKELSGVISDRVSGPYTYTKCWIIEIPKDSYSVRLDLRELKFIDFSCADVHLNFTVIPTNEEYQFCSTTPKPKPITIPNDVKVTYYSKQTYRGQETSFKLYYTIQINSTAITGVNKSRENVITWLKNQRTDSYGWGKNTHRAITALYLSGGDSFQEGSLEDKLVTKQLELQTAVALIRNSDDPISVNELSMFINALLITCRKPRQFYGQDLLEIVSKRVDILSSPSPGPLLTLCNTNSTISESQIRNLLVVLSKHSVYPFHLDLQAMSVMALTCIKNMTNTFYNIENATEIYNNTIKDFISRQQPDGSFGNVYTTAVVTQALLSSGQENNRKWDLASTMKYLIRKLNSNSMDFLSAYFVAPIFNKKTLVDVKNIRCKKQGKEGEDEEVYDIIDKLGAKMQVKYYLYIGDKKDIVHSIHLRMPKNSSAFDIMRVAQVVDHKFKFLHTTVSGHLYVYEIAGMTNDPETEKFWLTYYRNSSVSDTLHHCTESPEKLFLKDGDHLVMWYKTASA